MSMNLKKMNELNDFLILIACFLVPFILFFVGLLCSRYRQMTKRGLNMKEYRGGRRTKHFS
jgi:uncharacterized membrane protein